MTQEQVEQAARLLHEHDSDLPWDEAPDWVKRVAKKMATFALEKPGASQEETHRHWATWLREEGWVYDTMESERLRTHPMLKAYRELTPEQQATFRLPQSITGDQQKA